MDKAGLPFGKFNFPTSQLPDLGSWEVRLPNFPNAHLHIFPGAWSKACHVWLAYVAEITTRCGMLSTKSLKMPGDKHLGSWEVQLPNFPNWEVDFPTSRTATLAVSYSNANWCELEINTLFQVIIAKYLIAFLN